MRTRRGAPSDRLIAVSLAGAQPRLRCPPHARLTGSVTGNGHTEGNMGAYRCQPCGIVWATTDPSTPIRTFRPSRLPSIYTFRNFYGPLFRYIFQVSPGAM